MEDVLFLIKLGELVLKAGNRKEFEDRLKVDLRKRFAGLPVKLQARDARYYLTVPQEHENKAIKILSSIPGISGWAKCERTGKSMEEIFACAKKVVDIYMQNHDGKLFKVESRRSDKSFHLDSYGVSREVGASLLQAIPELKVNVNNPDWVLHVEVREKTYLYIDQSRAERGLPVGSAGRGLLLLSGGIDSPVAGYMMAKRGLYLDAVYYHAYPYTSKEAEDKVRVLAQKVANYAGPIRLHVLPFTEIQMKIKQSVPEDFTTLIMRACMMAVAHKLAYKVHAQCLITGESLAQVASQTVENLRVTDSFTSFPVFRPLIGIDKEDTINIAKRIDTFETSILPYEDCCVLFSPKHPVLRADYEGTREMYEKMHIEELIDKAISERTEERIVPKYED